MTATLKKAFHKLIPKNRLYALEIPVVGLTGNIGGGKSSVAKVFKEKGIQVIDADQLIHEIYKRDDTKNLLKEILPSAINQNEIRFPYLREQFFKNPELKEKLQGHLYNRLPETFLSHINPKSEVIIYDVPLLFERKMQGYFDLIFTVSTSPDKQLERLKRRDTHSSLETLQKIISEQLPIKEKEEGSNFVFDNNGSIKDLIGQVDLALERFFD